LSKDDPALNRLITTLLVEQGFQVTSVVDGEEAYRAIKSKTVDLMVLDLHLPGVNGAELLVLLNAEHRRVPVIVVSSPTQFESANLKRFTNETGGDLGAGPEWNVNSVESNGSRREDSTSNP
jgi:CheY-like chemotaxis protein